jgi:hypothetical protein
LERFIFLQVLVLEPELLAAQQTQLEEVAVPVG